MDVNRQEALAEAYSRGLLPPDMKGAYEEAVSRGLVGSNKKTTPPTSKPISEDTNTILSGSEPTIKFKDNLPDMADRGALGNLGMGFVHGVASQGAGIQQLGMDALAKVGLIEDQTAKDFSKKVEDTNAYYDNGNLGQSWAGSIGKFTGEVAPWVAGGALTKGIPIVGEMLGGSKAGAGILNRAGMGAAGGAAIGATQFVPEGGSRSDNAFIGGLLGGGINSILSPLSSLVSSVYDKGSGIVKKGYGYLTGKPESVVADNVLSGVNQRTLNSIPQQEAEKILSNTKETMEAGKRLGLQLTPAEASGNPLVAARQGALGSTDEAGQQLVAFGNRQEQAQQKAISGLFDEISPNSDIASAQARETAQSIIKDREKALAQKAQPFYESAESQRIPTKTYRDLTKDANIAAAINRVRNDPIYKGEIAGFKSNQVKVLDLAKKNLDDQIEVAQRAGEKNKVRILMKSKERLVSSLDEVSPDYNTARGIYTEGMPNIQSLIKGDVGRIADLSDTQLQNVGRIIFDPAETDIKTLEKIRDTFTKKDPNLWRQVVRNSMESKMEASRQASSGKSGSAFYSGLLSTDRQFNQYLQALKGIPQAQQTLIDMRMAFKNLINNESVKGAAGKAKSSLNVPRNSIDAALGVIDNFMGGRFDKAAVDLITSDKWLPYIKPIKQIKNPRDRAVQYANLLSRISALEATKPNESSSQ